MEHLILLQNDSDFTNHVSDYTEKRPYVVYVSGEGEPILYYSNAVLLPNVSEKKKTLIFDESYSTIRYDAATKSLIIDGEASKFTSYDGNEEALSFNE